MTLSVTQQQSVTRLRSYLLPWSVTVATSLLRHYQDQYAIVAQYQRCFPEQCARSTAPLVRRSEEQYSAREWEFFHLVAEQLFPLDIDRYFLDDERTLDIPVLRLGMELFEEDDLRPGWVVLAYLAGQYSEQEMLNALSTYPDAVLMRLIAVEPHLPRIPEFATLTTMSQGVSTPLAYLQPALERLLHQTDTLWLDCYADQDIADLSWCSRTVAILAQDWQEAQQVIAQSDQLVEWLEADIAAHAEEVAQVWISAMRYVTPS